MNASRLVLPLVIWAFLGLFQSKLHATHVLGGEITYRFLQNTPTGPEYEIQMVLYRDNGPSTAGLGSSQSIKISSSCFPTGSTTLSLNRVNSLNNALADGGVRTLDPLCMIDTLSHIPMSKHVYKKAYIIPMGCNELWFSWSVCCRSNSISNLVTPGGKRFYLETHLNRSYGENSSISFGRDAPFFSCLNEDVYWDHNLTETNGDSVYFGWTSSLENRDTALQYIAPHSFSDPFPAANGIVVDSSEGIVRLTASNIQGRFQATFRVEDWRFVPSLQSFVRVGYVLRESTIDFLAGCNLPPAIDAAGTPNDSLVNLCIGDSILLSSSPPTWADSIYWFIDG